MTICSFVVLFSIVFNPAFAQLTDNFDDAEIFSSPTWSGNTENFTALNNELQLMDNDPVLTQSYLSTPNTMSSLDGKEWRIWINQTFSGSDANQSRIYLTSNTSSFSYTANNSAGAIGYYLKLGEALSGDVLRFYKDDGTNVQLIASGTTNISASFQMRIKVSRNASGNWTIAIDTSGGENYVDEMTFTENSLNTSDYFGIVCTYTSSNADNFFFG